jgi:uncharacterized protein
MRDLTQLLNAPGTSLAIVGATDHPTKYGSIIYRDMKRKGWRVHAVNPYRETVDGDPCYHRVSDIPEPPTIAVFVIPAKRGLEVVDDCVEAGVENVWLQPGAFSVELSNKLDDRGFNWISEACVMVLGRTGARSG